jgi:hypothetical protein
VIVGTTPRVPTSPALPGRLQAVPSPDARQRVPGNAKTTGGSAVPRPGTPATLLSQAPMTTPSVLSMMFAAAQAARSIAMNRPPLAMGQGRNTY